MRNQELIGLYEAYQQVHGLNESTEELEYDTQYSYEDWVNQLVEEGYDLSNWTDEGLYEYYEQLCEESLEKGQSPTPGGINPKRTPAIPPRPPKGTPVNTGYQESYGESTVLGRLDTLARDTAGRVGEKIGERRGRAATGNLPVLGDIGATIGRNRGGNRGRELYDKAKETVGGLLNQSYEYDFYDTILEYLISEGYADTNENALAIMANMSEEWKESIVEAVDPEYSGPSQDPLSRLDRTIRRGVDFATGQQSAEVRAKQKGVPGNIIVTQSGPFSTKMIPNNGSFISDTEMRRRGQSTTPMGRPGL